MIEFLCGCKIENPELADEFGPLCPSHRMRQKGFLSPTMQTPAGSMLDYSRWAELTSSSPYDPDWEPLKTKDIRDMRDPQKMALKTALDEIAEPTAKPVHSEDSKRFFRENPADGKGKHA